MFEYCGDDCGHRSPAVKALVDMANIVIDPSASGLVHLGPLTALYGMRVDQWPWRVRMQLQVAVVLASSCLWRKLRRSLQCFPWLLVPLCDDNASEADQQAAAKRLFDCPLCCLDEGLGRRLRNSVDSWECLLQEPLRTFLKVFFQRAVVTSTFVERCFAALTRFSKPPQSCATLAAKHTNATFAQIVEQWRASQGVCAHEQTRTRPAWMQTSVRGFSLNGYQLFARDMKNNFEDNGFHDANTLLAEQWWALPAETRSDYSRRAASIRRRARCCESPLDSMLGGIDEVVEGPCNIASREGPFPIRPTALAEYLRGQASTERVADEWRQAPME